MSIAPDVYAKFKKETANDELLQKLQNVIFDGWPNDISELLHSFRPYLTFRDELSVNCTSQTKQLYQKRYKMKGGQNTRILGP